MNESDDKNDVTISGPVTEKSDTPHSTIDDAPARTEAVASEPHKADQNDVTAPPKRKAPIQLGKLGQLGQLGSVTADVSLGHGLDRERREAQLKRFFDTQNKRLEENANKPLSMMHLKPQLKQNVTPTENLRKTVGVKLELQTRQAAQLVYGRKGDKRKKVYAIYGLISFASEVGDVWLECSLNNPIADYYLLRIEASYNQVKTIIDERLNEMKSLIDDSSVFDDIKVASAIHPQVFELRFSCPWGYKAAELLKKFDDLVCLALTARHIGFLDGRAWGQMVSVCSAALRKLFISADGFEAVPVQREWFAAHATEEQKKLFYGAKALYSYRGNPLPQIPPDVMWGKTRASLHPGVKTIEGLEAMRSEQLARLEREINKAQIAGYRNRRRLKATLKNPEGSTATVTQPAPGPNKSFTPPTPPTSPTPKKPTT
jgi:integrating conjugative element protein (TIGR03761 family)